MKIYFLPNGYDSNNSMQALGFFQSASVCKCFANTVFSKYNICLSKENREIRLIP